MSLRPIAVLVAGTAFLTTDCALAQEASDASSDSSTDEVVVVATRTPEPLSKVGNTVTVLDAQDIQQSQAIVASDLLAQTPGLSIARTGGVGQPTSVFIRGAESDQTMVVIDGVPVTDPSLPGGGFDFENLLIGDFSRIEILRGSHSTLYGSQAMGGVINITTAEPTEPLTGGASLEGGSHATGYGTANLGGRSDGLMWRVAADWYGTSGIPSFDGGHRDCASQIGGASGQLRYDLSPEVQLDLRAWYTQARTAFDGYDTPSFTFGDDHEYGKTQQLVSYAGLTFTSPDRTFTNRIAAQYTDSRTRNYDPDAPGNYGSPSTETFYGFGRNVRGEYQGTWQFTPAGQLVFGAQHEHSSIETDTPAYDVTPAPLSKSVNIDSGYLQAQYEVASGLTLTGGGRYDRHDVYGGHGTGQAAAAWVLPNQDTILRASFGQGFKAPSLYQLYSNYGNQALRPEASNSWDFGVEQHALGGRAVAQVTYFQRTSRDLISFFDCTTPSPLCATEPFGYYANIERSLARGVEVTGLLRPVEALTLSMNYTHTQTEDQSPGSSTYGNELARRPRDMGNVQVSYLWPVRLTTTVVARYAGRTYDDAANTIALGGYTLIDLRASFEIGSHVEVYGRIENLTDHHYETAYQYGEPGRSAYIGAKVTL
ncbi:MAG: TonB-dependent receptor [Proteobacteria bacterium]|nr:TonB-dependent receptor [Pseudomonadota bacterium]